MKNIIVTIYRSYIKYIERNKFFDSLYFSMDMYPYITGMTVLITLICIFHVWSRVEVIELNLKVSESARLVNEVAQENERFKAETASLRSPMRIEALAKGEFGLILPSKSQMVWVYPPSPPSPTEETICQVCHSTVPKSAQEGSPSPQDTSENKPEVAHRSWFRIEFPAMFNSSD